MIIDRPLLNHVEEVEPEHLLGDLIQPGHPLFGLVWINPQRMSGTPCFYATRVPIQNLFDYIEGGHSTREFLDDFEGVTPEQVMAILRLAKEGTFSEFPRP